MWQDNFLSLKKISTKQIYDLYDRVKKQILEVKIWISTTPYKWTPSLVEISFFFSFR